MLQSNIRLNGPVFPSKQNLRLGSKYVRMKQQDFATTTVCRLSPSRDIVQIALCHRYFLIYHKL